MAGCTTMRGVQQRRETSEISQTMLLQEQVRQVSGRLENVQTQIDQLWAEMEKSQQGNRRDTQKMADNLSQRVTELEQSISRLDAARAKDKQEIIDKTSSSITKLLAQSAPATSGRRSSQYGLEHTVKPGETLSEISAAYGVRIKVLIEANSLRNPDQLRAGQKIFIPE